MRNFCKRAQAHRIEVHAPPGLAAEPALLEGNLAGETRRAFPIRVKAAPDTASGIHLIAFDVTLNGRRYGEWFDPVVRVEK